MPFEIRGGNKRATCIKALATLSPTGDPWKEMPRFSARIAIFFAELLPTKSGGKEAITFSAKVKKASEDAELEAKRSSE